MTSARLSVCSPHSSLEVWAAGEGRGLTIKALPSWAGDQDNSLRCAPTPLMRSEDPDEVRMKTMPRVGGREKQTAGEGRQFTPGYLLKDSITVFPTSLAGQDHIRVCAPLPADGAAPGKLYAF